MKIATWNVNSIRVRLAHVLDWLARVKPDVLALQEIKMPDDDFPHQAFEEIGYHAIVSGQKTYNGVALIIKSDLASVPQKNLLKEFNGFEDPQRRVLIADVGDVRVVNLYVPNGQSVGSDKYQYKLTWLTHLATILKQELAEHDKVVVLGDFNIAPADIDVHDPEKWKDSVLCSEAERKAFQQLLALGLYDCFRDRHPDEQVFSWWDYRLNAFRRKMGLRIDLILASKNEAFQCQECLIDADPRSLERPSDHAPVVATFS